MDRYRLVDRYSRLGWRMEAGWWIETTHAAADLFDSTAQHVEEAVGTAGDAVADLVQTIGHTSQDILNNSGMPDRLGSVVAGVTDLLGTTIKSAFDMVGGAVAGCCRIVAGTLLLKAKRVVEGSLDIGSSVAGAIIVVAGTFVSLVQRLLFLQSVERPLSETERELLRRVFRTSVSLCNVRIVQGWCGVFGIAGRPFALGNCIYFHHLNARTRPDILVHECVHVWQYQNLGARYAADALGAQAVYGSGAYDWRAEPERGRTEWVSFNMEAQAELIQNIWSEGALSLNDEALTGSGAFFDIDDARSRFGAADAAFVSGGCDYTALAIASVIALRSRPSIGWSDMVGRMS